MNTVCFYLITAYTPTFGGTVLHLATRDNMIVTLCVGVTIMLSFAARRSTVPPNVGVYAVIM